ncbi:CRISPR-associated endoribonuclease Cas6 [Streptomyces rubradiris]|uniref:CRISPR-associated endoribonuclease Cas6 n=1 Tax=Streptomyces rubradiris TaxID=285531 RepID=UPI0036E37B6E
MRIRVDVVPDTQSLRWEDVHGPARAVVYGLLESRDEFLARSLHDDGWGGQPLKPVGVTSPMFLRAAPRRGVYTTSSDGSVWFGSPVPEIASVLVGALAGRDEITWGATRLRVRGSALEVSPPVSDGLVELETVTPVLIKHRDHWLLPWETHYVERLEHNLAHKADVLGLPAPCGLRVVDVGPRRRFAVNGAPRIGAKVRVAMEANARFVNALRSWGLGLETIQGFGWIR